MDPVVENCISYITETINSGSLMIHPSVFENIVSRLSELLAMQDMSIQVNVLQRETYCMLCEKRIDSSEKESSVGLWCLPSEHLFCSTGCFKRHVLHYTNGTLLDLDRAVCQHCWVPIPYELIEEIFGNELKRLQDDANHRALQELLSKEELDKLQARFTCQICLNDLKVDEGITLDCDHRFCSECIGQHIKVLVEEAQVSEKSLKCPSCPQPLSVYEIEGLISPDLFDKFMKFRLRGIQMINASGVIFNCLGADCEYMCILDGEISEFNCPVCNFKCCPKCKDQPHSGSTCEQFKQWKIENGQVEEKMQQVVNQNGWLQCPRCGAVIERIEGCQFMTCTSTQCQSRTFLCYDCGKALDHDHAKHQCNRRPPPPRARARRRR